MVLIYGRQRLRGTVALQASIGYCCRDRMAIAGIFPGGRPLRRRRDMVLIYGRQRLRETVALQVSIIVAAIGWPLLADSLEGVRSVGAVIWC